MQEIINGVGVGLFRGVGDPLFGFFGLRDLSRFHHRKIPIFSEQNLGEADCFGPTQNAKTIQRCSIGFQAFFDLVGFAYVSIVLNFQICNFQISRFPKFPRFHRYEIQLFMDTL